MTEDQKKNIFASFGGFTSSNNVNAADAFSFLAASQTKTESNGAQEESTKNGAEESIASKTDETIDIPIEAQLNPPTNKVHKTEGGHLIEYDNTDGAKRINIKHASGTTININNDGTILIDAVNDIVNIDGNTTITGTLHVTGAQTNDSTIVAQDTITDSGATLATHTHPGDSGGNTGTPN